MLAVGADDGSCRRLAEIAVLADHRLLHISHRRGEAGSAVEGTAELTVPTWSPGAVRRAVAADLGGLPVRGVVPLGSDGVVLAAQLAEHFNLPGSGRQAAESLADRWRVHQAWLGGGCGVPRARLVHSLPQRRWRTQSCSAIRSRSPRAEPIQP
ncbi:hypothetical protein ACFQGX_51475 [Nonomuraea dietziae]|uniref:hypothetical protein n=1 Tax=Nonomuraea dietziae TaxID=65515 RepID=UPI0036147278